MKKSEIVDIFQKYLDKEYHDCFIDDGDDHFDYATFTDAVDFIKKNKNLFHSMMKKIAGMIIKILTAIALKQIAELVAAGAAKKQVERGKNQLSQLLSLLGLPQETLRIIKGLQ